ncbi:MAG TPA: peptidoglycan DD-metalloendopeptidase family protein [Terriglobales bacterium]|nr:peptidoglycan DD-metalloendopeptidase family protein [Terriglobales bacterium]
MNLRSGIVQCCKVWLITFLLLLCAPFFNSTREDPMLPPPMPTAPRPESRIGVTLRAGDTLMSVLKRFRIEAPSAYAMIEKVRPFVNPRKIRAGDNLHVVLNSEDQSVQAVELVVDDNLVRVKATGGGWLAERHEIPFVRENQVVRGTIAGSLYESGVAAGLSPQQIMDLAKVFEYDIDFFSDFQPDDAFNVIVEQTRYVDGRLGTGRILAAELQAGNESFDAFYYVDKDGTGEYYNSEGEAQRRAFLRAPLSYVRISSPFSRHRRHPIFRTVRPHLAIDYAAPAGTPVVAIGRGQVVFVGWRNGYGNVVDIRHNGNYMSRYAHFSRFASKLHRGQSVDAGDVIGFVGQTGHATGPHLHFEFLRGGKKINFLDLRIPKVQHLAREELPQFYRFRDQQLARLHKSDNRVVTNTRQRL